jgi:hypothetical protein
MKMCLRCLTRKGEGKTEKLSQDILLGEARDILTFYTHQSPIRDEYSNNYTLTKQI